MKQLIFIRHAKSDWDNEQLKDVDRHLNPRGYADAYFLGEWFAKNHQHPQRILSSSAIRAMSTALMFSRAMEYNMRNFIVEPRIYEASVATLLSVIAQQDNELGSLMLVGHNPGFTDICNELGERHFDNVPTCGIIAIDFDCHNWQQVSTSKGKVNYHQFPKDLKKQD